MKVVSRASTDFEYNYNKMTINDKATAHYKEMGSLSKYCSKIVEETCEKYRYKKPRFISRFSELVEKINTGVSGSYATIISESSKLKFNHYLFGVTVVILTHAANKKYKEILETINGTIYPTRTEHNSHEKALIMFLTDILTQYDKKIFGSWYSWETRRFFKMVCMIHLFKISENQFVKNENFRKVREEKMAMLKDTCNTDNAIPGYFKNAIQKMV